MEKKQQDYNEFQITPTHTWKYMKHNMKGTAQSIIKSALLNIFKISSEESIQTAPAKVWKFSRVSLIPAGLATMVYGVHAGVTLNRPAYSGVQRRQSLGPPVNRAMSSVQCAASPDDLKGPRSKLILT